MLCVYICRYCIVPFFSYVCCYVFLRVNIAVVLSLVVIYLCTCFVRPTCVSVVRYSVRAVGRSFLFDVSRYMFLYVGVMSLVIYWVVRSMCIYGFRYLCMSLCMRAWLYLCMCVFMYCCIPLYYLFSSFVWVVRSFLLY